MSEVLQPVFDAGRTSLTAYLSSTSEALTRKTWTRRPLRAQRACWRTNQAGWIPKVSIKVVSAFFYSTSFSAYSQVTKHELVTVAHIELHFRPAISL